MQKLKLKEITHRFMLTPDEEIIKYLIKYFDIRDMADVHIYVDNSEGVMQPTTIVADIKSYEFD